MRNPTIIHASRTMNFGILCIMVFFFSIIYCTPPKKSTHQPLDKAPEYIVDLRGKVNPKMLVAALQRYDLAMVKEYDSSANKWIFTYNPTTISADSMLHILKYEQFCEDAVFYKQEQ